ncbi:MAG: hypothetical protein IPM69_01920 [Ignavibacteria bacterium]|nr:hypothetical protein [Ignavibacteria bacterium]
MVKNNAYIAIIVGIFSAISLYKWYISYTSPTYDFPVNLNGNKELPVVIVFPAMGGEPATISQDIVGVDAIIIRFHEPRYTFPTFSATLHRAEHQVESELSMLHSRYRIDTSKIVCCGFSLGGDVAFALAIRRRIPITHALIMGSRCTYRLQELTPKVISTKFAFIVGANDERITQHNLAVDYLTLQNCDVSRKVIPGLSHTVPKIADIQKAFVSLMK